MAQFQRRFVQDLTKPLIVRQCGDLGFSGDNLSDVISVDLYTDGVAYSGGGTCAGACICPDGSIVALSGSVSGKTASVTLIEDCFAIPGQIGIAIRVTSGTTKTTVLKAIYNVEPFSTNNPVDPGSRISLDVGDLINRIDAAVESIPASADQLKAAMAPNFSDTTAHPAGAYVWNNGTLYRFTTAHAAGSWTGTDATAVALGNDVADLKSAYKRDIKYVHSNNLIDPTALTEGYLNNGEIVSDSSFRTTDYIEIESGNYVKNIDGRNLGNAGRKMIFLYDGSKSFLSTIDGELLENTGNTYWYSYDLTSTSAKYVRLTTYYGDVDDFYFGKGNSVVEEVPEYSFKLNPAARINSNQVIGLNETIDEEVQFSKSSNLINPLLLENGYIDGGNVVASNDYRTSGFIPVEAATYVKNIVTTGLGSYAKTVIFYYDGDKNFVEMIAGTSLESGTGWYSYDLSQKSGGYIRLVTYNSNLNDFYFGKGSSILNPVPIYYYYLNPNARIANEQIGDIPCEYRSSLTGKIWYAVGDSSTHGDFDGISQDTLPSGLYAGELPVYPFYIGNRTGMIVHNLAQNGMTMATLESASQSYVPQWSANDLYKSIGNDADIITIWLGANDMWKHVAIGTIDSSDPTTFYGAYNTVLSYYVNNYPNAKIGIVASFWCTQEYAEAVIALGAKYGVPVLNLYNDPSMPVTVGSQRPDVSEAVKTARNNQWIVSETNVHPSATYHEIESYFIEDWLKTL